VELYESGFIDHIGYRVPQPSWSDLGPSILPGMEASEVRGKFIDAYPALAATYLQNDDDPIGQGLQYIELGAVATYLGERLRAGETAAFPSFFEAVERCWKDGSPDAVELVLVGLIEALQKPNITTVADESSWDQFLSPVTRRGWQAVNDFWAGDTGAIARFKAGIGDDGRASVYLRIKNSGPPAKDGAVATLIEIGPAGYIPREVGVAEDGTPIYVTRPGEYGRFNDSPMPRTPPDDPAFEGIWGAIGSRITANEFESIYARADATLPHTIGGTPMWISDLVSWVIVAVVIAVLVGIVYLLSQIHVG
jgi:hypothetical protein